MSSLRSWLLAGALAVPLLAAAPASAQTADAAPATDAGGDVAPDPARMAVAMRLVDRMVPAGSMRSMMDDLFGTSMLPMREMAEEVPVARVAALGGLSLSDASALGIGRLEEAWEIIDPNWKARGKAEADAMKRVMGEIMDKMEPKMRELLASAYARRFDLRQLGDIERFFATPTGTEFAGFYMQIAADRQMMEGMTSMMPEVMGQLPDLMVRMSEASASVPPERKLSELAPDERAKLADLLGVSAEDLVEPSEEQGEVDESVINVDTDEGEVM